VWISYHDVRLGRTVQTVAKTSRIAHLKYDFMLRSEKEGIYIVCTRIFITFII
jgi:hypothetical protein